MRARRPENYSDTTDRTAYELDPDVFAHHLETLTARNQTHDFEIFSRKLCERAVCPNLRPATGPEGGGDSKADTETGPVAEELTRNWYVGDANGATERWAFAFSAKKTWAAKARADVKALVETGRGYSQIIVVTSQNARGKTRAALEDELTAKYGVRVWIHDRNWILQQVFDHDRRDLAYHYLGVGREVTDPTRLGASDYSRTQRLADIEKDLADPDHYAGMERQSVTEALLAAKLSRGLERPRLETDGRLSRAIRLADRHGPYHKRMETRFEALWTALWWFDDFTALDEGYDAFAELALVSDDAIDLAFVSSLTQMLFTAVRQGVMTEAAAQLRERCGRLIARLETVAANAERPNNALEARSLLQMQRMNLAFLDDDEAAISACWPAFSEILREARSLAEFDAEQFAKLIDAMGHAAGDDPDFGRLAEEVADFVADRSSATEGAKVRLNRAKQLSAQRPLEKIRLLGRAAYDLGKKESAEAFIDAMQQLSLAYQAAGLFWAARASAIAAAAAISRESEAEGQIDLALLPTLELLAGQVLMLRHMPEAALVMQMLWLARHLPLDDESQAKLAESHHRLDLCLASQLTNATALELQQLEDYPDLFEAAGLGVASTMLAYALGYEAELRAEGVFPAIDSPETVERQASMIASMSASDDLRADLVGRRAGPQTLSTIVLGARVAAHFAPTDVSILVAETVLAGVEVGFATGLELEVTAFAEAFDIEVLEVEGLAAPEFRVDRDRQRGELRWPAEVNPGTYKTAAKTPEFLTEVAQQVLGAMCAGKDLLAAVRTILDQHLGAERMALVTTTPTSFHRLFRFWVARLEKLTDQPLRTYALRTDRPTIQRIEPPRSPADPGSEGGDDDERGAPPGQNHRQLEVQSVIDMRLWDRAVWRGVGYATAGPGVPPILGLQFEDEAAARAIFEGWRRRFGDHDRDADIDLTLVTGITPDRPADYLALVGSRPRTPHPAAKAGGILSPTRLLTLRCEDDGNLRRFLAARPGDGRYLLLPATIRDGAMNLLMDLAVGKQALTVVRAQDLKPRDMAYGLVDWAKAAGAEP